VESIHSHFAKSFLAQHSSTIDKLKDDENIETSSELCIPEELTDLFVEEFFKKFPKIRKTETEGSSAPKGSIISPTQPANKSLKITAWPDICNVLFPLEMEKIVSSLELEKNVSWSVGKFVAEKIPSLNVELAQCIVDSNVRKIKTFGIPLALESQFVGWFRGKLQTGFDAYVDSTDTIDSGRGLQPQTRVEETTEEEDLNSLEISGLLEQLVTDPNSKNNGAENNEPVSGRVFGDFESVPRPLSPIWSFSWLSESANDKSLADSPTAAGDLQPTSGDCPDLLNIISENMEDGEKFSTLNGVGISAKDSNNSEPPPSIKEKAGIDDNLTNYFDASTPPRNVAEPVSSPLGSPIELTPDCSPEAVCIQPSLPLPAHSDLPKDLFGASAKGNYVF
jgi:hypothetical protein